MPAIPTAKATKSFDELSAFVSRQDVVDALNKAGKDRRLLRLAKSDPKAFLLGEGIKLPPRSEVTILQKRVAVSGQITICVQVCRQIGRFMVCAQICITIVFQA
jgi:hypothetical protein